MHIAKALYGDKYTVIISGAHLSDFLVVCSVSLSIMEVQYCLFFAFGIMSDTLLRYALPICLFAVHASSLRNTPVILLINYIT